MRIAIEGCCHGELDHIYAAIQQQEHENNYKVDLLLICGDFQSLRNFHDLKQMAVPEKYKKIGIFNEYYSGKKIAKIPTVFIGGNHEASNYLWELYHGGWVCPNIYYLGAAGVINFANLRIAGISGIFKAQHYSKGFFEKQPFSQSDMRSIYHVRKYNIARMEKMKSRIDIFLSHDWPLGIVQYGNKRKLLQTKSFLKREIEQNTLGSPPLEYLLKLLKPEYWFSAHLHVKFAATVPHEDQSNVHLAPANPDQIELDVTDSDEDDKPQDPVTLEPVKPKVTKFLSLDKCLPKRQFLQIIEIPTDPDAPLEITHDPEWLAIVKAMNEYMPLDHYNFRLPADKNIDQEIAKCKEWVSNLDSNLLRPAAFVQTAKPYPANQELTFNNPQTDEFCRKLEIQNFINPDGVIPEMSSTESKELQDAKERLMKRLNE